VSITTGAQLIDAMTDQWPRDDLELALTDIPAVLPTYDHAKEYDDINLWEKFRLSREGRTLRQSDIEYDPNYCSPVIDAVNNRLIITAWTATAGEATDTVASDAATTKLAQIVKANELDSRYRTWDRNTLRDGDGYIMVWPIEVESPAAGNELTLDIDPTDGLGVDLPAGVNITYHDPRQGRMFYDPENPRVKLFYAYMWETELAGEKQPRVRVNLVYNNRIEKWISTPGSRLSKKTAKDFSPFLDPDDDADNDYPGSGGDADGDPASASLWPMANPYGMLPVFHLRTDYEYGRPEHANAFGLQDAISKLIEMMMVTVEFNGYPQRYAIQEADSLGNQSIREDPLAEHSPADWDRDISANPLSETTVVADAISNETGSEYESNPGAMQLFKGFKEVGSFTVANPAAFLEPMKQAVMGIATTTSTPVWKFRGFGGTPPTGAALRIDELELVQKARDRMALIGAAYEDALECALIMLGVQAHVKISWANPATNDLIEVWQLVKLMIELGVPRDVAFMKAGVSEPEAQEWAKTYDDVFAEPAQWQAKALALRSQAELFQQQAMAAKIGNGVPQRQVFLEAGYAQADVDAWLSENAEELTLSRKVALLVQIATAVQSLGMGVNLGVLTADGANDIVAAVMGELLPEISAETLDLPDSEILDDITLTDLLPPVGMPMPMAQPGVMITDEPPMPPGQASWTQAPPAVEQDGV
jgi:hypothetical protein